MQNIARFLSWQIGSRLSRAPRVFELANGAKMLARPGMTGATGNLCTGKARGAKLACRAHASPKSAFITAHDVIAIPADRDPSAAYARIQAASPNA